ncbi:hypothetical protein [Dermatophilus congolensis]|uniref:hypothetical protein n=1 Tax=Dermatophilus congolensis TaxID=1863 RepID=UPI001AAF7BF4|nr:hypothetical protein [Dermatophilus congolensis]MBO3141997.1 hypothetical protein [Dermatophilus congolensis]MBO3150987.1 hypothetical protein [Dermatophilus congolensis]MBO3162007.1 hypothetical protein [Dermatophilus congolensis]MBO3162272.1 hypothetical protein [Dermatophilus congolensis]MBO3175826.1 hypothetical protein [Dermatophilus congolensis]
MVAEKTPRSTCGVRYVCVALLMWVAVTGCARSAVPPESDEPDSAATMVAGDLMPALGPEDANRVSDAVIHTCEVSPAGRAVVEATVRNSGSATATFIASVEVMHQGKRVDSLALIASGVEPGRQVRKRGQGVRTDLVKPVQCRVTGVDSVTG